MKKTTVISVITTLLVAQAAFARTPVAHKYSCMSTDSETGGDTVQLIVNLNGDDSQIQIDGDIAKLDLSFSPRLNKNFLRYEYVRSSEGTSEALVQWGLLDGAPNGALKLQNRGEGFFSATYDCTLDQ